MIAAPRARLLLLACTAAALSACGTTPPKAAPDAPVAVERPDVAGPGAHKPRRSPYPPAQEDLSKRGNYVAGGLYAPGVKDSAPEGGIPDVHLIPEPEVRAEPRSKYGNRSPYTVLGKRYYVRDDAEGYDETGIASYYGRKFHGRRTSSLEVYDMYAFSAAHKTLPLPSYARVTNLANGRSVVVRVNDRGPFHEGRIIDLSYAAAVKLGVDRTGTARVEVVGLAPGENARNDYDAVATAAPTRAEPAPPEPLPPSPMDALVKQLPEGDALALSVAPAVAVDNAPAAASAPVVGGPSVPPVALPPVAIGEAAAGIEFQVASFGSRDNAERALALLSGAGIAGARLLDGQAAGRPVWRLRVGPVAESAADALSARIGSLGFGQPQRVRE
jgi:rare lipoprotein A